MNRIASSMHSNMTIVWRPFTTLSIAFESFVCTMKKNKNVCNIANGEEKRNRSNRRTGKKDADSYVTATLAMQKWKAKKEKEYVESNIVSLFHRILCTQHRFIIGPHCLCLCFIFTGAHMEKKNIKHHPRDTAPTVRLYTQQQQRAYVYTWRRLLLLLLKRVLTVLSIHRTGAT